LEFSQTVTYKGKTSTISDFLSKEKLRLQRNFPSEIETPDAYNKRIDSIVVIAKNKLYDFINKEELPEWFIKYEENDIYFSGEYLKLYQFKQRYWFYNQIIKRDLRISENLRNQLDNKEFFTLNYLLFLDQIHSDKHDTLASPKYATNTNFLNYIHNNIQMVNEMGINSKMKSCFIASKLSTSLLDQKILRMNKSEFLQYSANVDSLYEMYCSSIAHSSMLACITDYKTTQYQKFLNRNPLMKGDKAPDFYLTDINGKFYALKDFQGKLIYLSFWATWCSSCIKTLPEKNAIIRKYENKKIEFINISFDSEKDKWEKLIEDYNILGLNLICKGNWEDVLKTNYYIQGIPKYVLINKNGEIIDSDAPSPGNETELTSLIDNYLDLEKDNEKK
jgi:thiol-disulfide isomerase/thioredoxin